MRLLLGVSALVLLFLAPGLARPWLGAMGLVAWLAGRWRPSQAEGPRLREAQTRAEAELIRRAVIEEEGLRTARLVTALKTVNSLQECLETVMQSLQTSLPGEAYGLYLEGRLAAGRGNAPALAPLLVQEVWRTRRTQQRDNQVSIPMESGVIWLERASGGFQDHELDLLESLAGPAALGIGLWSRQQALRHWSERLVTLVEGARSLIGSQDPQKVAELLEQLVRSNVPHQMGMLCGLGPSPSLERSWPYPVEPNWAALPARPQSLFQSERLVAGLKNWLAAPLPFEGGPAGVLLLGNPDGLEFLPEQATLLAMIAALGAGAMAQTHLYADLNIAHRELQESQIKLVQSAKLAAVGQLAAGMAHELNSPLGAIVLSLEGAQMHLQKRPEAAVKRLETARLGAQQCQHIVNSLLLYCRNQSLESEPVDLHEIVAETLLLTQGEFQKCDIELKVQLEGQAPILGNAGRLRQLITNLLVNARDAVLSPRAQARRISVTSFSQNNWIHLEVADQGEGMDAETLARAIEPFFTTKPVGRGTGLGLSLCHEIVQQHGGKLHLRSQLGHTQVQVELPLR